MKGPGAIRGLFLWPCALPRPPGGLSALPDPPEGIWAGMKQRSSGLCLRGRRGRGPFGKDGKPACGQVRKARPFPIVSQRQMQRGAGDVFIAERRGIPPDGDAAAPP